MATDFPMFSPGRHSRRRQEKSHKQLLDKRRKENVAMLDRIVSLSVHTMTTSPRVRMCHTVTLTTRAVADALVNESTRVFHMSPHSSISRY